MNRNIFKIFSIILSYVFFISVIIISINAVVPEKDLTVLKPKEILVKKIERKNVKYVFGYKPDCKRSKDKGKSNFLQSNF